MEKIFCTFDYFCQNFNKMEEELNPAGNEVIEPAEVDGPPAQRNASATIQKGIQKVRYYASNLSISSIFVLLKVFIAIWSMIFSIRRSQIFGWFTTILFTIFDIWYTQRIASLALAGIKYSCKTDSDGDFEWKFEELPHDQSSKLFWTTHLVYIVYLVICFIVSISLLKGAWIFIFLFIMILNLVHLSMLANCIGFWDRIIKGRGNNDNTETTNVEIENV